MNRIQISPRAKNLINALRNTNITAVSAINEFIDNSFDAGAKNVAIYIDQSNLNSFEMMIVDDGQGMSYEHLQEALTLGTDTEKKENSTGKFGIGLKVAAMNLFDNIRIVTKTKDGQISSAYQSFSEQMADNEFMAYFSKNVTNHENEILLKQIQNSGTAIFMSGDRFILPRHSTFVIQGLPNGLGKTYRHLLMSGKTISINNKPVIPIDPTYPDEQVYSSMMDKIRIGYLKSSFNPPIKTGGLFIIRNGREVFSGGFPKSVDGQKMFDIPNEILSRIRMEMFIDKSLDSQIMVDFNKQNVVLEYDAFIQIKKLLEPTVNLLLSKAPSAKKSLHLKGKKKSDPIAKILNDPRAIGISLDDTSVLAIIRTNANGLPVIEVNNNYTTQLN